MKRYGLLIAIVLALVTLSIALYFLFFRGNPNAEGPNVSENPFGDSGAGLGEPRSTEIPEVGVPVQGAGEEVGEELYKITDGPVAHGAVALNILIPQDPVGSSTPPAKKDTEVRYVDRASGNMYQFRLGERTLERMTNLTLPGIQEALWAPDGSRAFLRFLSTESGVSRIETYSLSAEGGEGYFLEPGLSSVVVGVNSILSALSSSNGTIGTRATLVGTSPSTVFSSQLSALTVMRSGTAYAAITKPSAQLPGYAFSVSSAGVFTRLLGPLSGLSVLPSPSGTRHVYSYRDGGTLRLALLDTVTNDAVPLPVATIAEKCVWASDSASVYCAVPRSLAGSFPDDWYLGVVQTSDRIWKIDVAARVAALEFDPSVLADEDIDAVALTLDSENEVLVFTNRDDGSLWLYDL